MSTKLYYIYDPMCSWCWGYRPVWDLLQQHLPKSIAVEYVVGGLAADSDSAMPIAQQQMIQNHWRTIEQKLGTRFNHDFWRDNTPRRSTYNACRAAIAANKQSCQEPMIDAIQQAYYLRALNPSDVDVLVRVAT
ncbi:MAG TPA: DsbA family protein, partial [Colwellia sp.]|nr:DsbA family protein [Colwellia sp.]